MKAKAAAKVVKAAKTAKVLVIPYGEYMDAISAYLHQFHHWALGLLPSDTKSLLYPYLVLLALCNLKLFLYQGFFVWQWSRRQLKRAPTNGKILIQYPIRNEHMSVVDRFIQSLITIPEKERYRFHLQILDDYDAPMPELNFTPCISFEVIRRTDRTGYDPNSPGKARNKAGNLNYGLSQIRDDYQFIMIYDADHRIPDGSRIIEAANILEANPEIGIVQSRWVLSNLGFDLISFLQLQQIGSHIDREQTLRSYDRMDLYPIMNGAGAIFRMDMLKEIGGWHERTVTEDIDISFKINSMGKKILVFSEWETLIDCPKNWKDFRAQWRRWSEGSGQVARLHLSEKGLSKAGKVFWLGWVFSFPHAPLKYLFLGVLIWRLIFGGAIHWVEWVCLIPHIFAWIGGARKWDGSIHWGRMILYPFQFILELGILDIQISGWYRGFFSKKEIEFNTTPKVA